MLPEVAIALALMSDPTPNPLPKVGSAYSEFLDKVSKSDGSKLLMTVGEDFSTATRCDDALGLDYGDSGDKITAGQYECWRDDNKALMLRKQKVTESVQTYQPLTNQTCTSGNCGQQPQQSRWRIR